MIHFGAVVLDIYALTMSPQDQRVARWNSPVFGERVYFVHSLNATPALAWQVIAGTLAG